METTSLFDRMNNWLKRSVTIKLLSIGILILLLLIPTSMLQSLISERQYLRDSAIEEVSSKWGGKQTVGGPVITVPYLVQLRDAGGRYETVKKFAHFLPDNVRITGKLNPEKRYRGIYVVVLYNAKLEISGNFGNIPVAETGMTESSFLPEEAYVTIGISDLKGVNDNVMMKTSDSTLTFGPGIPSRDILSSGISAKCPLSELRGRDFSFELNLNGSTNLEFLPFGKETRVSLASDWGNPSFEGSFLPDSRHVADSGFSASWQVLQLNRNYPQSGLGAFIGGQGSGGYDAQRNDGYSSFGVRLLLPVDEYQKTMRSVKYCIMLIIITFLTFFFVEVLNRKRIHPIQYLLVGFAICLFYVLLLSVSEHIPFSSAYLIGSVATIALISFYARYIFGNLRLTVIFTALLILMYGFFYSLLQLEDYALLLGSIGLFIILTTIMYLTRKVNWYND